MSRVNSTRRPVKGAHIRRKILSAAVLLVLPTSPALCAGDDDGARQLAAETLDRDEFLGRISMSYLEDGFQDRVDGFSGNLHINMVDVRLPGNGGLEIVVQRYYSSNVWNRVDNPNLLTRHAASVDPGDRLGGSGWQLHMGKIVNPYATPGTADHATLIMADGSTHPLFTRSGYPGQKISPEGWIYTLNAGVHTVTLTNGMVYVFDEHATGALYDLHDGSHTPVVQCTSIEDVNGNAIDIEYNWAEPLPPHHLSRIESIWFDDPDDARSIDFTYLSGTNRIHDVRVKNGVTTLQTWNYAYGSPQAAILQMDGTSRTIVPLTGLTPPEGNPWVFGYFGGSPTPGNGKYLLQKVTLPSGGVISYGYAPEYFETGSQTCVDGYQPQFAVVTTRTLKDRDNSTIGTWSYTYTDAGEKDATTVVTVKDPSNTTVRTEAQVFHGWGSWIFNDPNMWRVGLPKSVTVSSKSSASTDLEVTTEFTTWQQGSQISGDVRQSSLWNSCASSRQMIGITYVKPAQVVRVVKRTDSNPDSTFTTTSSDFDDWGNPRLITETSDDGLSRTTEIEYWQNTAHNIMVGRIESRDPDPGGAMCFRYDSLGRVTKHFVNPRVDNVSACAAATPAYARETRFAYDSAGNLIQEIRENGTKDFQTTLSEYAYGQPEKITVENGTTDILYCKSIGPMGTVEWETDGRDTSCISSTYRTFFDYDDIGRVTTMTPPLGYPTSFDYAENWSTVTVKRGTYDIRYSFDGFGRLGERRDLETQHRIELEYDPLGTRRKTTNWFGTDLADTLDYDPLGRLTTMTHPDGASVTFTYDGSKVNRTDENGHATQFFYQAFGHPDDRRLDALIDANNKVTSFDYDSAFGQLSVVDAPISRADRRFSYYTGQSNYWNGFLKSEDNPETGEIVYQYDRLGDTTARTRANGADITTYTYDTARRLTGINVSGTAHDLSFVYDGAGLRTKMSSEQGTFDYGYDRNQRMVWKMSTVGGVTYRQNLRYDSMDRLWQTDYPSGRTVEFAYNPEGRLEAIIDADGSVDYITGISYKDWGGTDRIDYQGGASTQYGYDSRFRVNSIHTTDGPQNHLQLGFEYDDASNLETWTDYRDPGGSRSFGYDKLDRLISATAAGLWGEKAFTYNEIGDRTTITLNGATGVYTYESSTGRLASVSGPDGGAYGYDAFGRLTSSPYRRPMTDLVVNGPTPPSQTVDEGGGASITVTASGGTPPYAYQWQFSATGPASSFNDIANGGGGSGATTSQITISPAAPVHDGWYRCRVSDGSLPQQTVYSGAAKLTVQSATTGVIGEVGSVVVKHTPKQVSFSRSYSNPVVFAQPASYNGGDTSVVRITQVTPAGFSLFIHEAPNRDGPHVNETVHWVVLEEGEWVLDNGSRLVVGTTATTASVGRGVTNQWHTITFNTPLAATPVTLTQVQTNNDPHWIKTRQHNADANGFQMAMEQDDAASGGHGLETVGWLATEPFVGTWNGHPCHAGNTSDVVTHSWYTIGFGQALGSAPQLVASLATYDGSDGSAMRYQNLGSASVNVRVEEDTTWDTETNHTNEAVSFIAIGNPGLLTGEVFIGGPPPLVAATPLPAVQTVNEGDAASFTANATGWLPPFRYRWQFSGTSPVSGFSNIFNGGSFSGTTTDHLTIDPVAQVHDGWYRYKVCDSSSPSQLVYSAAAELIVGQAQQYTIVARDGFGGGTPGAPINGRITDLGGLAWHANAGAVLGIASDATGLTGTGPNATLDFEPADYGNGVTVVEAELKPQSTNWVALGLTEHAGWGWWVDGQVSVLVKPSSLYNVFVDGTEISLIGGAQPIPTSFDPNGYNTVKLVYDPIVRAAEVWINDVQVMGPTAVPDGSDGLPPAVHYAGWSALGATQNETGVDDFELGVITDSAKRLGFESTVAGGRPSKFDLFPAAMTSPIRDVAAISPNAGNTVNVESITYTWTPLDALESATTPEGMETYTYDGDGLRITKIDGADQILYIRDGSGQIIAEYDEQGHLLAEYVSAMGHRVAKVSASGLRYYYHTDLVGTPLVITDQNGNLSWRGEYLPFGTEFTSTDPGDHFKFTGKELEDHTGLYYFEARYYDPVIGRFISVDPVGGNVENSQSWNRYGYVEGNPLRYVDPTGMMVDLGGADKTIVQPMRKPDYSQANDPALARAVDNVMAVNAASIVIFPLALAAAPEALLASITTATATKIGAGAAVGLATSAASISTSNAPVDQKVNAVMAGAFLGGVGGPLRFSGPTGGVSAILSRLVADRVSGQERMSTSEGVIEIINGMAANQIASTAKELGPLSQIVVAGLSKFVLDRGAELALGGSPASGLSQQQLREAYVSLYGGSR
jgi:RHS repeat-associated protein